MTSNSKRQLERGAYIPSWEVTRQRKGGWAPGRGREVINRGKVSIWGSNGRGRWLWEGLFCRPVSGQLPVLVRIQESGGPDLQKGHARPAVRR